MHDHEPCGVDGCPALVVSINGFCAVHEGAKQVQHVMAGAKCSVCGLLLVVGDWLTRDCTLDAPVHAHCPEKQRRQPRKKPDVGPLVAAAERSNLPALVLVALLGLLSMACGASSPAAPSAPVRHVALTVRALAYITNMPIAHVAVDVDGAAVGQTDAGGALALEVIADVDHVFRVHAAGLTPLVPAAEAVITSDGETWTFWLAPAS